MKTGMYPNCTKERGCVKISIAYLIVILSVAKNLNTLYRLTSSMTSKIKGVFYFDTPCSLVVVE